MQGGYIKCWLLCVFTHHRSVVWSYSGSLTNLAVSLPNGFHRTQSLPGDVNGDVNSTAAAQALTSAQQSLSNLHSLAYLNWRYCFFRASVCRTRVCFRYGCVVRL